MNRPNPTNIFFLEILGDLWKSAKLQTHSPRFQSFVSLMRKKKKKKRKTEKKLQNDHRWVISRSFEWDPSVRDARVRVSDASEAQGDGYRWPLDARPLPNRVYTGVRGNAETTRRIGYGETWQCPEHADRATTSTRRSRERERERERERKSMRVRVHRSRFYETHCSSRSGRRVSHDRVSTRDNTTFIGGRGHRLRYFAILADRRDASCARRVVASRRDTPRMFWSARMAKGT